MRVIMRKMKWRMKRWRMMDDVQKEEDDDVEEEDDKDDNVAEDEVDGHDVADGG